MQAIRQIGCGTLQLDGEPLKKLENVREKAEGDNEGKENVKALMSSIEIKVAELLLETGN